MASGLRLQVLPNASKQPLDIANPIAAANWRVARQTSRMTSSSARSDTLVLPGLDSSYTSPKPEVRGPKPTPNLRNRQATVDASSLYQ